MSSMRSLFPQNFDDQPSTGCGAAAPLPRPQASIERRRGRTRPGSSRAAGTNPRAMGTNPRALAALSQGARKNGAAAASRLRVDPQRRAAAQPAVAPSPCQAHLGEDQRRVMDAVRLTSTCSLATHFIIHI